jgi:hypothetical protein
VAQAPGASASPVAAANRATGVKEKLAGAS